MRRRCHGADRGLLWFAPFHDVMRENEFDDPGHRPRGGELARRLNQVRRFTGLHLRPVSFGRASEYKMTGIKSGL